jgi:hypothetical protein
MNIAGLDALSSSLAFYFLRGFRYAEGRGQQSSGTLDTLLGKYIHTQQMSGNIKIFVPREQFPQAFMYLPDEALTGWRSIIEDSPILPCR